MSATDILPSSTTTIDNDHDEEISQKTSDSMAQESIPISYDVADVVWVKLGGHPWWPSLIIRDPNDPTKAFTKIIGSTRAKRMYFVVFYGATADFAWVSDSSILPYNGVDAFRDYAQEMVDKAPMKSQKEQLSERFQLKVTASRRDDWNSAVKEADQAKAQSSEQRLEQIEPKIEFYTAKLGKSMDDESSNSLDGESTPPIKRRAGKKHDEMTEPSHSNNGKKRGRPRLKDSQEETSKKKVNPSISTNKALLGQHHRFDHRIGFLTPYEEQEVFNTLDQLRSTPTFEEAEEIARRKFEQILSVNLNRTDVSIPPEWFYSFLFAHPILIVKNVHWFEEKSASDLLKDVQPIDSTNSSVFKQQLAILSKLYQNQLELRPKESSSDVSN